MNRIAVGVCAGCQQEALIPDLVWKDPRVSAGHPQWWHPCANQAYGLVTVTRYEPERALADGDFTVAWRPDPRDAHWLTLYVPGAPVLGVVNTAQLLAEDDEPDRLVIALARTERELALPHESVVRAGQWRPRDQIVLRGELLAGVIQGSTLTFSDVATFRNALVLPAPHDAGLFCWAEVVVLGRTPTFTALPPLANRRALPGGRRQIGS